MTQIPIHYRDFWDVPRAIIFEHNGKTYFLDCRFDEVIDEYPDFYLVYCLRDGIAAFLEPGSDWTVLPGDAELIGRIQVKQVVFDLDTDVRW